MNRRVIALNLFVLLAGQATAQPRPLTVTGHLQGFSCMALNLSHEQLMDWDNAPPVFAEPNASAARIGVATASVIAKDPPVRRNEFQEVLHMDGRPGWIKASMLKPWRNLSNPSVRCTPAMMSNGRPGFDYSRP